MGGETGRDDREDAVRDAPDGKNEVDGKATSGKADEKEQESKDTDEVEEESEGEEGNDEEEEGTEVDEEEVDGERADDDVDVEEDEAEKHAELEFEEFADEDKDVTEEAEENDVANVEANENEEKENDEEDEWLEEEEEEEEEDEPYAEEEEEEEVEVDDEALEALPEERKKGSRLLEHEDDEEAWPSPSTSRRWNAPEKIEPRTDALEKTPSSASSQPGDRRELRRLEKENKALRLEIGQERFKVQQLQKLQAEASQAQRREQESRRKEAIARRELEEAKSYVSKRHTFALNEKAELLKQIETLERRVQEFQDREVALRLEVQEAVQSRSSNSNEQIQKDAERWRKDACDLAARLKQAEVRLHQLEQRKQEDKVKLKVVGEQLKAAVAAGFAPEGGSGSPKAKHVEALKRHPSPRKDGKVVEDPVASKKSSSLVDSTSKRPLAARAKESKPSSKQSAQWPSWLSCNRRALASEARAAAREAERRAPGAEKKLKPGKSRVSKASELDDGTDSRNQNTVVAVLVLFIVCLAAAKLYL